MYGSDLVMDEECNHPNLTPRVAVAKQGYGFDKLINDSALMVRAAALDSIENKIV